MSSDKLKVVVVDDDPVQVEIISSFVEKTNFLKLQASFTNPVEAMESIVNDAPDLLLLDVQMPDLNGLELIKSLPKCPATIIVTGNKEYAIEAFELDVTDYLLKPVDSYPRFLKAVNKVKGAKIPEKEHTTESLFIKEESLLVNVATKDIKYLEACGDYVKVFTPTKVFIVHSTMGKMEKSLSADFIRVHRSYIVRLDQIKNIDLSNLQIGEKIIPVSQSMRPTLMSRVRTM
ncbi:MAG: response regulator transcription factor [Cyclobacteriaceae bacterium]|nr:response regulator transcription factor [Cyclobacteriaceae bacterium HetDA_MAG_MS6]